MDVAMVIPIIVTDLRCISVIYCKIYCYTLKTALNMCFIVFIV